MPRKFAAFDIDGTLIRWQLYHSVVDRLAKYGHLGLDAHEQLHQERMVWKRREHPEAFGRYEKFVIGMYEKGLTKLQPSVFDRIAHEVAHEYKDQVYTYTRDLIKKLKDKGYMLLAISGSHDELVGIVAQQHGFDDWLGSVYQRGASTFTGKSFIVSKDKKTELEKLIAKHNLDSNGSYGVGDSFSDASMMDIVEHPIAFNPDRKLFNYAHTKAWPVVVERKNVIYELAYKDGTYVLAQTNAQ